MTWAIIYLVGACVAFGYALEEYNADHYLVYFVLSAIWPVYGLIRFGQLLACVTRRFYL